MSTLATSCGATMIGSDQDAPPLVERITATLSGLALVAWPSPPFVWIRSNPSISTPSAGPAVGHDDLVSDRLLLLARIEDEPSPCSRCSPPSVVFEKSAGPRNAGEWLYALGLAWELGDTS